LIFRFPDDVRGWLTRTEGEALAACARGRVVLEIGSYCGRSTICMAQTAKRVYALDWHRGDAGAGWGQTLPEFLANIERYGVADKVIPLVGRTDDLSPILADLSVEFVFVDGAHDADSVRADTRLALRVLKPGGVIAFHDFDYPSVRDAVASVVDWPDLSGGAMFDRLYVHKK
jgi:predicted O-methyltransferase YrrM